MRAARLRARPHRTPDPFAAANVPERAGREKLRPLQSKGAHLALTSSMRCGPSPGQAEAIRRAASFVPHVGDDCTRVRIKLNAAPVCISHDHERGVAVVLLGSRITFAVAATLVLIA